MRGAVLVGGASRRMGRRKAMLEDAGQSWLARIGAVLAERADSIVLVGEGPVPRDATWPRLPDDPAVSGPLGGVLAALRSDPGAAWIVVACDQPDLSLDALDWLLAQRAPGVRAVLPRVDGHVQPLLSFWEAGAADWLIRQAPRAGEGPRALADRADCATPDVPAAIASAWQDYDTPEELARRATRRC